MNKSDKTQYAQTEGLLSGDEATLSSVTISALEELGTILGRIHKRMVSEGYEIVNGDIRMKVPQNVYEKA